jgi:hypothetical protein
VLTANISPQSLKPSGTQAAIDEVGNPASRRRKMVRAALSSDRRLFYHGRPDERKKVEALKETDEASETT